MKFGFAANDITPRVGVELCGFGAFINRKSIAVREPLFARAMAIEQGGARAVLISCDLVGTSLAISQQVRAIVAQAAGVTPDAVMVHSTHTHSGPCTGPYIGWGEMDPPYVETLPHRIAKAAIDAFGCLQDATLSHAAAACEGIGLNREYDRDAPPLAEVLADDWRPAKPELTDTLCHVLRADANGRMIGFVSYFGCHPVVCCSASRYIHGDYCGVATNLLMREHPGSVGLFCQGAQGDVNSCVVHKGEQESLLALDVIAARYANAVRHGLAAAKPIESDCLRFVRRAYPISRKPWGLDTLRQMLAEKEQRVHAAGATDASDGLRMDTVYLIALRRMVAGAEAGQSLTPDIELQGLRVGPVAFLGTPFEIFQAIKNEVKARASAPIALVMGLTNDSIGYAPDHTAAARGGYAADMVPLICASLPFANIHDELVGALLDLDAAMSDHQASRRS